MGDGHGPGRVLTRVNERQIHAQFDSLIGRPLTISRVRHEVVRVHNAWVATKDNPSKEFLTWQRAPDRSAAGVIVGLVLAWMVGGYLVLVMAGPSGTTPAVSGTEFLLAMVGPAAMAAAACKSRRARYWAGAFLPGAIVGWMTGCLSLFLVLALFVLVS